MTEELACILCGRKGPRSSRIIIPLTPQELRALPNLQPETVYCMPCHDRLTDPDTAAALMKGSWVAGALKLGVRGAEKITAHYDAKLREAIERKQKKG